MAPKGILWVASKIADPKAITPEKYEEWYRTEHFRDVLASGGIKSAFWYKNIDPNAERPYFALYPVQDTDFFATEAFKGIPNKSNYFPEGRSCFEFCDFDTRFYEFVDAYEKEGVRAGPTKLVISAALEPAKGTDDDFDAWYRKEHYRDLAGCTGYVRTRRYKLQQVVTAKGKVPTYLALHEFESDSLPQDELQKTAETSWAKKTMDNLEESEVFVFKLEGSYGEVKAKF